MENIKHIIVVDDDIYLTEMVRQTLLPEGYRVTVYNNGINLLDHISETNTDLILLDIKMPGIDGYEILKQIQSKFSIPIIMLTGISTPDSMISSIDLGADDYIIKPFYPQELVARIKARLRRYNLNC
jgi:DNA-binding response OmpR family regulator